MATYNKTRFVIKYNIAPLERKVKGSKGYPVKYLAGENPVKIIKEGPFNFSEANNRVNELKTQRVKNVRIVTTRQNSK